MLSNAFHLRFEDGSVFVTLISGESVEIQNKFYTLSEFYRMALFVINKASEVTLPEALISEILDLNYRLELVDGSKPNPLKKEEAQSIAIRTVEGDDVTVSYCAETNSVRFQTWTLTFVDFLDIVFCFHSTLSSHPNPDADNFNDVLLATFQVSVTRQA